MDVKNVEELYSRAEQRIANRYLLVRTLSERINQLSAGARPLVWPPPRLLKHTALVEVANGMVQPRPKSVTTAKAEIRQFERPEIVPKQTVMRRAA